MAGIATLAETAGIDQRVRSSRYAHMTACTSGSNRLDRVNGTLRIEHIVLHSRQDLFRPIYVAHRTVTPISRCSCRTHGGKAHLREVVVTSAESHNIVGTPFRLQMLARMDSVDQQVEIYALSRLLPVLRILRARPSR